MRMEYQKPMLYAEHFVLNEHITACSRLHSALFANWNQCGYALNGLDADGTPLPGPVLFTGEITQCSDAGDPELVDAPGGGLCYNFFMDEGTLMFGS